MSTRALVLAAHGSRHEPEVNAAIRAYADAIGVRGLFDEVAVAFHQGEPPFSAVLDQLRSNEVVVVPVMTSEGYYSDYVLPRELAKNRRLPAGCYAESPLPSRGRGQGEGVALDLRTPTLRITSPLGTHPAIVDLMNARLRSLLTYFEFLPRQTSAVVVGHGTPRHPRSRNATAELAAKLARRTACTEVLPAFLDEEPFVDAIVQRASCENIIVLLFLIGAGPHATRDIPRRIGMSLGHLAELPVAGRVGDRQIVCDAPIGTDPGILDIIIELSGAPPFAPSGGQARRGSQVLRLEGVS